MISTKKLVILLFPFITLPILLIITGVVLNPVARAEGIWVQTSLGEMVYANVYHPKNPHQAAPVVISFHGISLENDVDYRMVLELTKRGFYIIAVDQSGHGWTHGIQPGLQDDVLKPFFFNNVIEIVDYIYSRADLFNTSAIGCMGFSLGGWTTLMATVVEPRINASVSWAGVANVTLLNLDFSGLFKQIGVTPENDFFQVPELQLNHSCVEYWNGTYGQNPPKNLLLIHGTADQLVPISQARQAYALVDDPSKCDLVEVEGADHGLLSDIPINETIAWFETKLLGGLQAPIEVSQFSYIPFYVVYIIILVEIYSSVFGIMFFSFKLKDRHIETFDLERAPEPTSEPASYSKTIGNLLIYSLPVLGIWGGLYLLRSHVFNHIILLLIGAALLAAYNVVYLFMKNREEFSKERMKLVIKSHLKLADIGIAVLCASYFLGFYFIVAYSFKFLLFGSRSILLYLVSFLAIVPFILTYEIFHRNIIQKQFPYSNGNKFINRTLLFGYSIISFAPLYLIISGAFVSVLIILIFLVATTTLNIYLYEKSGNVLATTIFATIVVAFFVGQCYFFFI